MSDGFKLRLGPRDDAPTLVLVDHEPSDDVHTFACPHCSEQREVEGEQVDRLAGCHAMCGNCRRSYTYPNREHHA